MEVISIENLQYDDVVKHHDLNYEIALHEFEMLYDRGFFGNLDVDVAQNYYLFGLDVDEFDDIEDFIKCDNIRARVIELGNYQIERILALELRKLPSIQSVFGYDLLGNK